MGIFSFVSRSFVIPIACLVILTTQLPSSAAEDILLYRLKKLRDSFMVQINDQVANNENLVEASYLETVTNLITAIGMTQRFAVEEIGVLKEDFENRTNECIAQLPVQPKDLFTMADQYLNECIAEARVNGDSLSDYWITKFEDYQLRAIKLSLWFMDSYLSDFENIFSSAHYNDVYDELANQVVRWDNVGSVAMFKVRQESIRLLNAVLNAAQDCSFSTKAFIEKEISMVYATAVKLCR